MWRTTVLGGMGGGSGGGSGGADAVAEEVGAGLVGSAVEAAGLVVGLAAGFEGSPCPELGPPLAVPTLGPRGGGSFAVAGPHAGSARAKAPARAIEERARGTMGEARARRTLRHVRVSPQSSRSGRNG